jgi:hypothetical protein
MFSSRKAFEIARKILDEEMKTTDLSTDDLELLQAAARSQQTCPRLLANMCVRNAVRNLGAFQQIPFPAFDRILQPA